MDRVVEPEWLDELPATDASARESRRDLRRVNALMGHARITAFNLRTLFVDRAPGRLIELGAGDGTFAVELARRLSPIWKGVELLLVDRANLVGGETSEQLRTLGWNVQAITADVFDFLRAPPRADGIIANLFLHHFTSDELRHLFEQCAKFCDAFTACEPRRSRWCAGAARLLGFVGCNHITRHDAIVSVRAGFAGNELSALWPSSAEWICAEQSRGLFSHAFAARRRN